MVAIGALLSHRTLDLTAENNFSSLLIVKQWGIERYKGFLIAGSAVPDFATKFDWYSQGTIFRRGHLSSIVEIKRIQGLFLTPRKRLKVTVWSCAKTGLTNGLDGLPSEAIGA